MLKTLIIFPKEGNPIPRHELIRMAGAKAKTIEQDRDRFFPILWEEYVPEYHVYVVMYDDGLLSENSVLEGGKENGK